MGQGCQASRAGQGWQASRAGQGWQVSGAGQGWQAGQAGWGWQASGAGDEVPGTPGGDEAGFLTVIELRVLTPDDWSTWRQLRLAALAEAPYAFGSRLADWQGEGDREERWRARLGIPGSFNVVAVLDGEPAGMASGVPAGAGAAELISMWVSPAARGHGVGDHLVQAVARWARRAGSEVLRLAVARGNESATELYRRNGFQLTGELGDLMPGGVHREYSMAKDLSTRA